MKRFDAVVAATPHIGRRFENARVPVVVVNNYPIAGLVVIEASPNHVNARPNKLFEYMAAGLPVVASNFPSWKELVEGNQVGRCADPLNPIEISDAITYIANHPEQARAIGERGGTLV